MTINKEQAVSDAPCRHLTHLPSGKCLGCGEQHQPLSDYQPGDDEAFMREHLAEAASHPLEQQQVAPSWRSADTYELGQVIFNHLHGFLNAAGINGTDCKITITVPTERDRKHLTQRLQSDMGERGSPRSAGRIGNSAGSWQGIAYEFVSRSPVEQQQAVSGDVVERAIEQLVINGRAKKDSLSLEQRDAADDGARAFYRNVFEHFRAALTAFGMGTWQPIETAPKDEWVTTWSAAEGHGLGRYCDVAEGWGPTTHWMPLPEPPRTALQEEGVERDD